MGECRQCHTVWARIGVPRDAPEYPKTFRESFIDARALGANEPTPGRRRLGVESVELIREFVSCLVPEADRDGEPAEDAVEDVGAVRRRRAR